MIAMSKLSMITTRKMLMASQMVPKSLEDPLPPSVPSRYLAVEVTQDAYVGAGSPMCPRIVEAKRQSDSDRKQNSREA